MLRVELTFNNGKFIAFTDVKEESLQQNEKMLSFRHGFRDDICNVVMSNLNFMEVMDQDKIKD